MTRSPDKCFQCGLKTLAFGGWERFADRFGNTYHFCSPECQMAWDHEVELWEAQHEKKKPQDNDAREGLI